MRRSNSGRSVGSATSARSHLNGKGGGGGSSVSAEYSSYLKSYESMVRQQDLEYEATSRHMRCILDRIQTVGSSSSSGVAGDLAPRGMLTYPQMRRFLLRMGVTWKRSLPRGAGRGGGGGDDDEEEDSVSVLSFNSTSTVHSGMSGSALAAAAAASASGSVNNGAEIIATDAQLVMLLTTLVEAEERHRAAAMPSGEVTIGSPEGTAGSGGGASWTKRTKHQLDRGIFLPELVQAYKLIVSGMQSLAKVSPDGGADSSKLSERLKDRTVGMLRPFGPDCKMYHDRGGGGGDEKKKSAGDALSPSKQSMRSSVRSKKAPPSPLESPWRVMRSKDVTLARIVEEHEHEMDAMATSMEELRLEEARARSALRRRRRRTRAIAGAVGCLAVAAGVAVDRRNRDHLSREIAAGREAERLADAAAIAGLREEEARLAERLGVIEGKMRYQTRRNDELSDEAASIERRLDSVDMKWLVDKAEMERCATATAEAADELQVQRRRGEGADEELVWCRSRLRSQEMELNELEHVSAPGSLSSSGGASSLAAAGEGRDDEGGAAKGGKSRPVYLEMKYSRSMRNSMLLRQAYSAAGGLAASLIFRGLAPAALRLLFGSRAAAVIPVVPPARPPNVEMMVVDGIFGSSVAFLLLQALATFVSPL